MMKQNWLRIATIIISISFFIVGCGGGSGCSLTEEPVVVDSEIQIDNNFFDENTSTVVKDIVLEDNKTDTAIELSEGTVFVDEDDNPIEEAPIVKVKVETKETDTTTELQMVSSDGEKVIPTEPVAVSIPAPEGAEPGDTVRVEVPDDAEVIDKIEKLILVVVGKDGKINILIQPEVFRQQTVIVIIVEAPDKSTN